MKKLSWLFQIVDRFTGPLDKAEKGLKKVRDAGKRVSEGGQGAEELAEKVDKVRASSDRASHGFRDFVGTLHDGLGIVRMLISGFADLATGAYNTLHAIMSFTVGVAAERESALVGLTTVLGDQQQAQRTFQDSLRIAQLTPFETADVIRDRTSLVLAGFTAAESRVLYAAAADISSAMGPERGEILQRAFQRIHAEGGLSGRVLEEIDASGVGRSAIFETLARRMGRSELLSNQRALRAWAEPVLGRMSSDQALNTIVDTIERRVSGGAGQIGMFSQAQSGTLTGLMSNLSSLPHDLLAGLDLEHLPGIVMFKNTLQRILTLFDSNTAAGSRFMRVLGSLVSDVFELFFGPRVLGDMGDGLDRVTGFAEDLHNWLQRMIPQIQDFGRNMMTSFGNVAGPAFSRMVEILGRVDPTAQRGESSLAHMGSTIGRLLGDMIRLAEVLLRIADTAGRIYHTVIAPEGVHGEEKLGRRSAAHRAMEGLYRDHSGLNFVTKEDKPKDEAREQGHAIGRAMGEGISAGLTETNPNVARAAADLANASTDTVRDRLEIHSPSRVFERLGQYTAQGFMDGLNGGLQVDTGGLTPSRGGLRGGGPVTIQVNVTVQVGAGGSTETMGQQIGEAVAAAVRDALHGTDLSVDN